MRTRRESMPAIITITITAATNVIVIMPRRHHTAAASRIRHGRTFCRRQMFKENRQVRHVMRITQDARRHLRRFLAEDVGRGDVTGALLPRGVITASIITRQGATVAGTAHAREIFRLKGCRCRTLKPDGSRVSAGDVIMKVRGEARAVLACERTALNLLSRMSGIATRTAEIAGRLPAGVGIYATRKTAPGLRMFDKEAVEIGGGRRHRMGLDESIMIKDNHVAAASLLMAGLAPEAALEHLIRKAGGRRGGLEAEVDSVEGAITAARAGAGTIMLDNFTPRQVRAAIRRLESEGLRDGVRIEASGGITGRNISAYASSGADMISVGFITHSVSGIDMSLEV